MTSDSDKELLVPTLRLVGPPRARRKPRPIPAGGIPTRFESPPVERFLSPPRRKPQMPLGEGIPSAGPTLNPESVFYGVPSRPAGPPTERPSVPKPKRKQDRRVRAVRADRDDLSCFACDQPAHLRISSDGVLGASCCSGHKFMAIGIARRKLPPVPSSTPKNA